MLISNALYTDTKIVDALDTVEYDLSSFSKRLCKAALNEMIDLENTILSKSNGSLIEEVNSNIIEEVKSNMYMHPTPVCWGSSRCQSTDAHDKLVRSIQNHYQEAKQQQINPTAKESKQLPQWICELPTKLPDVPQGLREYCKSVVESGLVAAAKSFLKDENIPDSLLSPVKHVISGRSEQIRELRDPKCAQFFATLFHHIQFNAPTACEFTGWDLYHGHLFLHRRDSLRKGVTQNKLLQNSVLTEYLQSTYDMGILFHAKEHPREYSCTGKKIYPIGHKLMGGTKDPRSGSKCSVRDTDYGLRNYLWLMSCYEILYLTIIFLKYFFTIRNKIVVLDPTVEKGFPSQLFQDGTAGSIFLSVNAFGFGLYLGDVNYFPGITTNFDCTNHKFSCKNSTKNSCVKKTCKLIRVKQLCAIADKQRASIGIQYTCEKQKKQKGTHIRQKSDESSNNDADSDTSGDNGTILESSNNDADSDTSGDNRTILESLNSTINYTEGKVNAMEQLETGNSETNGIRNNDINEDSKCIGGTINKSLNDINDTESGVCLGGLSANRLREISAWRKKHKSSYSIDAILGSGDYGSDIQIALTSSKAYNAPASDFCLYVLSLIGIAIDNAEAYNRINGAANIEHKRVSSLEDHQVLHTSTFNIYSVAEAAEALDLLSGCKIAQGLKIILNSLNKIVNPVLSMLCAESRAVATASFTKATMRLSRIESEVEQKREKSFLEEMAKLQSNVGAFGLTRLHAAKSLDLTKKLCFTEGRIAYSAFRAECLLSVAFPQYRINLIKEQQKRISTPHIGKAKSDCVHIKDVLFQRLTLEKIVGKTRKRNNSNVQDIKSTWKESSISGIQSQSLLSKTEAYKNLVHRNCVTCASSIKMHSEDIDIGSLHSRRRGIRSSKPILTRGDSIQNLSVSEETKENMLCLFCGNVFCGRYTNRHMLDHMKSSGHLVVIGLKKGTIWCYGCDTALDPTIPELRRYHRAVLRGHGTKRRRRSATNVSDSTSTSTEYQTDKSTSTVCVESDEQPELPLWANIGPFTFELAYKVLHSVHSSCTRPTRALQALLLATEEQMRKTNATDKEKTNLELEIDTAISKAIQEDENAWLAENKRVTAKFAKAIAIFGEEEE